MIHSFVLTCEFRYIPWVKASYNKPELLLAETRSKLIQQQDATCNKTPPLNDDAGRLLNL